jgi:hypothetical protein
VNGTLFLIFLIEAMALALNLWAVVLLFKHPNWAWEQTDHSRSLWMILLIVAFFLPVIGVILSLWFVLVVSPSVRRMHKLDNRIGFPGDYPGAPPLP